LNVKHADAVREIARVRAVLALELQALKEVAAELIRASVPPYPSTAFSTSSGSRARPCRLPCVVQTRCRPAVCARMNGRRRWFRLAAVPRR